jgi:hypothetical protein
MKILSISSIAELALISIIFRVGPKPVLRRSRSESQHSVNFFSDQDSHGPSFNHSPMAVPKVLKRSRLSSHPEIAEQIFGSSKRIFACRIMATSNEQLFRCHRHTGRCDGGFDTIDGLTPEEVSVPMLGEGAHSSRCPTSQFASTVVNQ